MPLEFEWDPRKAVANVAKHKESFEEAATVFGDPLGRIVADPRHSSGEERFVLLGQSRDVVRIVSARSATRAERRSYEENTG